MASNLHKTKFREKIAADEEKKSIFDQRRREPDEEI